MTWQRGRYHGYAILNELWFIQTPDFPPIKPSARHLSMNFDGFLHPLALNSSQTGLAVP